MVKNYQISEIEKWHFADIIAHILKLVETDNIESALEVANLLRKKRENMESDTYFNTISEISMRVAKKGNLTLAEELVSKIKMPVVDNHSLEDSIRALLIISKEYVKKDNIPESRRILSVAKTLLFERNSRDEIQADLALSLAKSFTEINENSTALELAEISIKIVDERLFENKNVNSFGFEERKIISSSILLIAEYYSLETAKKIAKEVRDDKAREKVNRELEKYNKEAK